MAGNRFEVRPFKVGAMTWWALWDRNRRQFRLGSATERRTDADRHAVILNGLPDCASCAGWAGATCCGAFSAECAGCDECKAMAVEIGEPIVCGECGRESRP